ncbi:Nup85p Ecym_1378 [Eremothecium cymbalariae DBVPG|uniref:Nuclear pore complex protein Nup85 n=1 Tax=Eremothecium cymbalariae (strain CBS 270.75 / DBVPG 7215 / KCTC 17166 / NRRL Y-17582) TaxID=931890 RepID=G8JNE7_ERECY|nr:hypothetical protein Ecym_1378 [Eremothecium cymbalariae DBVPG\
MTLKPTEDMLMDVDGLEFATTESSDSGKQDLQFDVDPVCNVPMVSFPTLSKQPDDKNLHFKFGPVFSRSFAFNKSAASTALFPVAIPYIDNSVEFSQYVSKLFEIYKSLGPDKQFNIPTIGLIKHSSTLEHNQTVNLAFEAVVSELEFFIESLKFSNKHQRFVDLEECLCILSCLKTVQFTLDSEEPESRAKFINSLINWVNRSDGEPSEAVIARVLDNSISTPVHKNPYTWSLLCQLILRGLFEQSVAVLERSGLLDYMKSRCSVTHTMLLDVTNLLQSYPYESETVFREWKDLVLQLYAHWNQSTLNIEPELKSSLEDVLLIMSGNKSKILYYSKTWYECYCGLMLYYIPALQLSEEYLQIALQEYPLDITSTWEQACVDIIMGKIYSILPVLDSLDSCTAAFTASICEAKGLLENDLMEDGGLDYFNDQEEFLGVRSTMSSYLLNQFALSIVTYEDKDLWPIAVGILSLTPNYSDTVKRMIIAELLPHYPFKTNDDIEWMLTICAKWKLPHVARTVYRILGQDALYLNNVIEAMSNFSKAGEFEWVKHYSWMIFEASVLQGSPLEDEIVSAIIVNGNQSEIPKELIDAMVTTVMKQTLSPYAVLFEFYQSANNNQWEEALELLLSLIEFPYLPPQYLILLLGRFIYPKFLQDDSKLIKERDILRIIKSLEKFDNSNETTRALYNQLLIKDDTLPHEMASLIQLIRTKLNFKLCQEFM